jgi:serine/threonine protein kinase
MAPEIHAKLPYQARPVDLFASAVILFIMVAQHPPFTTAVSTDHYYKLIAQNRADWFWKLVCNGKENGENTFSPEFKDLFQSMIQLNFNHRPSMSEILTHPWLQGETAT